MAGIDLRSPGGTTSAASALFGGGAWTTGTSYTAGTEVVQGGVNYACVTAHTSGTFATDLAAGKWVETGVNSASAVSLSNTVPPRPGTPAAGTATTARRGDAVQGSFGLFMFYGDGRNGAATFDGATAVTGFARAGSVYTSNQATFFTNVTVNSGVTVICQAPMHASGTLTNNGTMQMNGTDASGNGGGAQVQVNQWFDRGGPAGNGATGAGAAGSFRSVTTGGGGQGGAGGSGNAGANAGGTTSGTNMTLATGTQQAEQPLGSPLFAFWGLLMVTGSALGVSGGGGGGGGGGDGTNSGGGGGSGAGVLVVNANILAGSGAFQANGGKGANGTGGNAGGGGGGGGGVCLVNTTDATGWSGTTTATGGAGGTGVGTGANGVTGTAGYASLKTWV